MQVNKSSLEIRIFPKTHHLFVWMYTIFGPILTLMVRAKLELWFLCIRLFSKACSWLTFADTVGTVISKASDSPHSVSTLIIVDILFLFLFPLVIVLKLIRVRPRFKLLLWNSLTALATVYVEKSQVLYRTRDKNVDKPGT